MAFNNVSNKEKHKIARGKKVAVSENVLITFKVAVKHTVELFGVECKCLGRMEFKDSYNYSRIKTGAQS